MKYARRTKGDKREIQQEMTRTYPPRLEGVVKNAGIKPVRKAKEGVTRTQQAHKPQGPLPQERKNYQLKGPRH